MSRTDCKRPDFCAVSIDGECWVCDHEERIMNESTRPLTTKEIFKPVACTTPLNPCTFCGWPAELYSRSNADGTFSEKAVMCSNFGDDDPTGNACPLHLPPEDFYHATKREAVEYWNERTARGKERITAALAAEVAELRRALTAYVNFSAEAHALHDADKDMKVLKLLAAMSGRLPKYRADVDAARAALGEQP